MPKKTHVVFDIAQHSFCCGMWEVGEFSTEEPRRVATGNHDRWGLAEYAWRNTKFDKEDEQSCLDDLNLELSNGSGMFTASFIDRPHCEAAYNLFTSKYELLYQSPIALNKNSGNKLFTCIFRKKTKK